MGSPTPLSKFAPDGNPETALSIVLEQLRGLRQHVSTAEGAQRLSAAEQLVIMQSRVEDAGATLASDGPQHVSLHSKSLRWQSQKERVDAMDAKEPIHSLMMANPGTSTARKFLLDRFGVPLPDGDTDSATSDTIPAHAGTSIVTGLNAPPAIYVPAEAVVHGDSAALLHCLDRELKHGLMHLVNRGLLPPGIDLTTALSGQGNVLHASPAKLLPGELKHMTASGAWEAARVYAAASRADARHSLARGARQQSTDTYNAAVEDSGLLGWHTAGEGPGGLKSAHQTSHQSAPQSKQQDTQNTAHHDTYNSGHNNAHQSTKQIVHQDTNQSTSQVAPEQLARSAEATSGDTEPGKVPNSNGVPVENSFLGISIEESGDPTRQYEQLMDDHSGHYIVIRKGETLDCTPEFESFQRVCAEQWPEVASLLLQIEAICVQYAVPTATVDGKKLARLASELGMGFVANLESLLACVDNIQEVAEVLQRPGQRFKGPSGRDAAALVIQTFHRGFLARLDMKGRRRRDQACRHIQSEWRRHKLREDVKLRLQEARELRWQHYLALQDQLAATWETMRTKHRIVIHLPSIAATRNCISDRKEVVCAPDLDEAPEARGTCASDCEIRHLECAQLPRICDVADPKVDVLFVSPVPLSEEVERYWNLMLAQGGVTRPESRYRIVYPENGPRMPSRLSLTAKLLSSPRAMRRLSIATKDRPAIIVPSTVTEAEIELATALNVPLLGTSPAVVAAIQAKAGARALFQRARMNVSPGLCVQPVEGSSQVLGDREAQQTLEGLTTGHTGCRAEPTAPKGEGSTTVSSRGTMKLSFALQRGDLIVKEHPDQARLSIVNERKDRSLCDHIAKAMLLSSAKATQRWMIKLEEEDSVRGLAFFDIANIAGLEAFLRETVQQLNQAPKSYREAQKASQGRLKASTKVSMALSVEELRVQAEVTISDMLLRDLRKALTIVCTRAYPDYRSYVQAVREKGAVIEAAATMVLGSPSACVLVEPTGNVKVVATMERMFHPTYCTVGHVFPQVSVTHSALSEAAAAIGDTMASIGFIGHAKIDFTVLRNKNSQLRMWATDLSVGPSLALASFQLFDFLSAGDFAPRSGVYAVHNGSSTASSTGDIGPDSLNNEAIMNSHIHVAERCYVSCEMVAIQDSNVGFEGVLQACSTLNCGFDMATRSGISFSVFERMRGGFLGLLGSGASHSEAMSSAVKALEIILGTLYGPSSASRDTGLRGLVTSLKFLASRLDPLAQRKREGQGP